MLIYRYITIIKYIFSLVFLFNLCYYSKQHGAKTIVFTLSKLTESEISDRMENRKHENQRDEYPFVG